MTRTFSTTIVCFNFCSKYTSLTGSIHLVNLTICLFSDQIVPALLILFLGVGFAKLQSLFPQLYRRLFNYITDPPQPDYISRLKCNSLSIEKQTVSEFGYMRSAHLLLLMTRGTLDRDINLLLPRCSCNGEASATLCDCICQARAPVQSAAPRSQRRRGWLYRQCSWSNQWRSNDPPLFS